MIIIVSTVIDRRKQGLTALNPKANRIDQLEKDLVQLKQGVPVEKPVYNHTTGVFDPPVIFPSAKNPHSRRSSHAVHTNAA